MGRNVVLYALSTCAHCRKTRELLESILGEDGFQTHYVDRLSGDERNDRMRELRRVNPELSFPTTVIDGATVVGAREARIRELLA
ncbi:MAG: glutaredoxin family protein [Desulfovibrionaceae bacterium]